MSRLEWIDEWIALARAADYTAERLAQGCRVSERQLRRYFLLKCHRPPQEWLDELRLWHAARLLYEGEFVKRVAAELNFSDAPHLCHRFKEHFGDSPLRTVSKMRLELSKKGYLAVGWEDSGGLEPWKAAELRLLRPLLRRKAVEQK